MKASVDLYLNADRSKVVKDGDPDAASLLVNAGREIPDAEVEAMGAGLLAQARALSSPAPEPVAKSQAPQEDKSVSGPPEDKGSRRPGDSKE